MSNAVTIASGASIQAAIDANPAGTTFQLSDGIYRQQSILAQSGDQFLGAADGGTIIDGAAILSNWMQSGNYWVAAGLPAPLTDSGVAGSNPLATDDNDLFINNVLYQRVGSLSQVTAGKWYFDPNTNSAIISDNPTGRTVEYSETPNFTWDNGATNVVMSNLTFEKFANGPAAVIHGLRDATLNNVTAEWNHGCAVALGTGTIVQGGTYSNNGREGLSGANANSAQVLNATVENNNYAGYNPNWDAGGMKFTQSTGMIIQGNTVRNNNGVGIWADIDSAGMNVSNNTVVGNAYFGIMYEISHGGTITNNQVSGNSGSGIYISNSDSTTVSGNNVSIGAGNTGINAGIDIINDYRGSGPNGVYQSINDTVQNNTITHTTDTAEDGIWVYQALPSNPGNVFNGDTYNVPSGNGGNNYWRFGSTDYNWTTLHQSTPYEAKGVLQVGGTPPPPPLSPSPNGTTITSPSQPPIIDGSGNAWSLVQSANVGLQIAVNGTIDPATANVMLLETLNGAMVQETTNGNWYSEVQNNDSWALIAPPPPPPTPPSPTQNGTVITSPSQPPIIDRSGNAWSLVQSASVGLQIAVNGTVDPVTANAVLLETLNGAMVQETTNGNWYSEAQNNDSWALVPPAPAPVTVGSGSDTLVLNMSEDAFQGDAKFTVSVDGNQLAGIFTAYASHAAGASQAFTFKGDWAPITHTVAVNFLNDLYAGTAATDRNLYVNAIGYDGTNTNQSATLLSAGPRSFSVTDGTAIPAAVTGSGSDSLVLSMSEDAYKGNAQFTVSLDGKQLGGTFTATALHSSGSSQNFVFNGDFGSGQHTVAVNFLNDAWAGTATTDRNLYVNAVTYNGTNTGQSMALMSAGPKSLAVSGGTTPSVSETGDHGSLQKNLSQIGNYTVGADTFVLNSNNSVTVTLGIGASRLKFVGASSATLTGGTGVAVVNADAGSNKFVAGTGSLDVTGGGGKDAYVFHSNSGLLSIEDFSLSKGDTLTVDKALEGALSQVSDNQGGTMLTFGATGHGVDIHGIAALPTSKILWA
jgi:parallel beta-helix repeat protein